MRGAELHQAAQMHPHGVINECFRNVANAALRHAIDSGAVATKEAYDQCRADLLAEEQRSAARDMAIAEAVRDAAIHGATRAHLCFRTLEAADFDLSAIIAKVPA
jgi:hypothetical protein